MKRTRVAVIGRTGRGDYGHGIDVVWKDLDGVEIVAVADDDEKGRGEAAKRLGVSAAYADYREMLAKERPAIVSVCPRWIDAHRDMVLACAEHGASVFLEKPMCRTPGEADEMIRACEASHVKLAIAHQTRYSPKVPVIRKLIEDGAIGELLELRGRGKEDRRAGAEDLWVLGTHVFDLMRIFAGEPRWCFAEVTRGGRPAGKKDVVEGNEGIGPLAGDGVDAIYRMESGATAHFSSRRGAGADPTRFGLALHGSKGIIEMGTGYLPVVKLLRDPSWSPGKTGSSWIDVSSAGPGKPEPLEDGGIPAGNRAIVKDLIRAIEEDRDPLGSARDGRAAVEMIAAVFASHAAGGPVKLPLEARGSPVAGFR
jgi:predicted dehydrogenase